MMKSVDDLSSSTARKAVQVIFKFENKAMRGKGILYAKILGGRMRSTQRVIATWMHGV